MLLRYYLSLSVLTIVNTTHVFLPRNYRYDMNADPAVVKRCAAKAVEQKKDVFEFANNQWNDECKACVLPPYPSSNTNENKTFFERLPSLYDHCSCRNRTGPVQVLRNRMGWHNADISRFKNPTAAIEDVTELLFDRMPNNMLIRIHMLENSDYSIYADPLSEGCVERTESVRLTVMSDTKVRVLVNGTLHRILDSRPEIVIAKEYEGSGLWIIDDSSLGLSLFIPTLHHMLVCGGRVRMYSRSFHIAKRANMEKLFPKYMGEMVDETRYDQLFNLAQFPGPNEVTNGTAIADCDYVCWSYAEWASIRSAEELQASLAYVNNNNATNGKHKEIAIALVRSEDDTLPKTDRYAWNDGSPLGYTNWKGGAPSESLRKNVVMNLTDGTWTDVDEDYEVTACLCRNAMI